MRWWQRSSALLVIVVLGSASLVACGDDDDSSAARTTTSTTSTSTTTSTTSSSTTTAFAGSTSPTSIASHASATALLTAVDVSPGVVTFAFRSDAPGIDAEYVEPPITEDASGRTVDVKGSAFLSIRMEPASGVDLSSGDPQETYAGPAQLEGTGPIVEVRRTGDFEANLTWVIGLDSMRPYRVEVADSMVRVYVST
jgi:hypothetical protein